MLEIAEVKCQQRPAGPIGPCYELDYAAGRDVPLGETFHWQRVWRPTEKPLVPGHGGIDINH
jgi:hypothetical protein